MTREEREEAIKQLQGCIIAEERGKDGKPNGNVTCELTKDILDMAIKALEQEPRKGHWKTVPHEQTLYCSECNLRLDDEQTYIPLHYCPNCGAKMEREE